MEYLTKRRSCKEKKRNVLESRTRARGELCPLSCQENFADKVHVTVHFTWVSKSTCDTHKYSSCSSCFRQKCQGLRCTFVIRIGFTVAEGPAKETPADVELLALCPAYFSTVWQGLQRPQGTTQGLCWEVVTASVSHPWRTHL